MPAKRSFSANDSGSKQYWGQCLALGFGSDFLCVQQINLIYTNIDFNQYEIHFFYNRMFDGYILNWEFN